MENTIKKELIDPSNDEEPRIWKIVNLIVTIVLIIVVVLFIVMNFLNRCNCQGTYEEICQGIYTDENGTLRYNQSYYNEIGIKLNYIDKNIKNG